MRKDDYNSVFRNIRTPRRVPHYYPDRKSLPEPAWLAFSGVLIMGVILALLLY